VSQSTPAAVYTELKSAKDVTYSDSEYTMKFRDRSSSVAIVVYCGAAVLLIINGQPTTDDDVDKEQISELIDTVAELRAKVGKLEDQLAATSTTKPNPSKSSRHSPDCMTFVQIFLSSHVRHNADCSLRWRIRYVNNYVLSIFTGRRPNVVD